MPDLMIMTEMTAPSHASSESPVSRKITAATSVDAEITESSTASFPEFIRESELTLSPVFLTYLPRKIFTRTAAATIIRVTAL